MALFACLLAAACLTSGIAMAEEVEFQDTPLLTSMWQATSSSDNDALDRLLDSSAGAVNSRASDGRGLAWWAFEFQNTYALGAIIAYGGDILSDSQDLGGEPAVAMCEKNPDCSPGDLAAKAKEMSVDIARRKEEREKERREMQDEEEDIGDDEFEGPRDSDRGALAGRVGAWRRRARAHHPL
eukprot:CAMPEP_0176269426 /NCGR_PEP_ID=MMETSP0121_2-20121125/44184_1 /TAXON_ID=160619 /ORGANISM="Kryptoperidinium foliaceum, Strain CCMP 1326" /LENGTH=182 /DNA_ID=CAMNT_0017609551 /DNA_START=81 /DNA_END=630 /DNA_ORIENTATION=+